MRRMFSLRRFGDRRSNAQIPNAFIFALIALA